MVRKRQNPQAVGEETASQPKVTAAKVSAPKREQRYEATLIKGRTYRIKGIDKTFYRNKPALITGEQKLTIEKHAYFRTFVGNKPDGSKAFRKDPCFVVVREGEAAFVLEDDEKPNSKLSDDNFYLNQRGGKAAERVVDITSEDE